MSAQHSFTALSRPKSLHHQGAPTFELVARPDGAFHLRNPDSGLMRAADGIYNFVRVQGALRSHTPLFVSARAGHAALAQGQPVLYAGTLAVQQGRLSWWSNYSGTYQPSPHFRTQARLPDTKFIPWQKLQMGGVGLQRGMLSDHRPAGAPTRPDNKPTTPRNTAPQNAAKTKASVVSTGARAPNTTAKPPTAQTAVPRPSPPTGTSRPEPQPAATGRLSRNGVTAA